MIQIENVDVYGWESAIRGMRNPMNSWDKSDSIYGTYYGKNKNDEEILREDTFSLGKNDLALMKKLRKAGTDHRKFMRFITVTMDITAPLYWWKEYDTYKVGTVANSCSTMHKIQAKEFKLDDFSHEHLYGDMDGRDVDEPIGILNMIIDTLNYQRKLYLSTNAKSVWWQMIQLLPSSYNQKRTVVLNYEVLANIYHSRKNHKLDEWITFCLQIKNLPYSELITGEFDE